MRKGGIKGRSLRGVKHGAPGGIGEPRRLERRRPGKAMATATATMKSEPRQRPIVIGLLGGIAGGKSAVARLLAARGALVLDADAFAHEALAEPAVRRELLERHGHAIARASGSDREPPELDRRAVARVVFADAEHRRHLEGLIHPRVRDRIERGLAAAVADEARPAVVLDVPLLLESSPFADRCDLLLFVDTPDAARRERAAKVRGWDGGEIARRDATQWSAARKRAVADVVLDNSGSEGDLGRQVDQWLQTVGGFAALARRERPPPAP